MVTSNATRAGWKSGVLVKRMSRRLGVGSVKETGGKGGDLDLEVGKLRERGPYGCLHRYGDYT